MELASLSDVLVQELGNLYSAEQQLVEALPDMASKAHSYALREAFETHLEETRRHVERLEQVFGDMGIRFAPSQTSHAMHGLLQDSGNIITATGDSVAMDAALISTAQRVEHYEIACYATARALAGELGLRATSSLLDQTLDDESRTNKLLTKLASGGFLNSGINRLAAERTDRDVDASEGSSQIEQSVQA